MEVTQTFTITLTQREAEGFVQEIYEVEGYLQASPDKGNTRTGVAVARRLRKELQDRGIYRPA